TEHYLLVIDRVAAEQCHSILNKNVQAASHYVAQDSEVDSLFWEACYGQRSYGGSAHGPDIVYRVQRGNSAVVVGGINDWRKEVYGLNERQILADQVDSGIVGGFDADQKLWIRGLL